jgi:enamine deaminase RidA (YjgF/YER057c/UK114 family)
LYDVVDVTSFHVDPENHAGMMLAVKDEIFPGPDYPNWTAVGATWLSGFQLELTAIARTPAVGGAPRQSPQPPPPI